MLYSEFINYAGFEVSYGNFKNVIEPMWLDYSGRDKEAFCKNSFFRKFRVETESEIREQIILLVSTGIFEEHQVEYTAKYAACGCGGYSFLYEERHCGKFRKVSFFYPHTCVPFEVHEYES